MIPLPEFVITPVECDLQIDFSVQNPLFEALLLFDYSQMVFILYDLDIGTTSTTNPYYVD